MRIHILNIKSIKKIAITTKVIMSNTVSIDLENNKNFMLHPNKA